MKFLHALSALFLVLSFSVGALADEGDGWGRNSKYTKLYNSSTVESFTGEIAKIDRDCRPMKDMASGFCVLVRDKEGHEIEAQVGPIWFTAFFREKWNVREGDTVTVTGSMVEIDGKKVMMVRQGNKGDLKMACRSSSGLPVWDLDIKDF